MEPPLGSGTSRATSRRKLASAGTAAAAKELPEDELSTFRYASAPAFSRSASNSPHSVLPVNVNSSASHDAKINVRHGFQPLRLSSPKARAVSIRVAVPLLGSTPPKTHASRWLPSTPHSFGRASPRKRPTTFQIERTFLSFWITR